MKNFPPFTSLFGPVHSWLRFFVVAALFFTGELQATPAQAGSFSGQHFSNASLTGTPTNTSQTNTINYNWGTGSPAGLPTDFFSNRWSATIPCAGGQYTFNVRADDGVRLYIDGTLVIDGWTRQTASEGFYSAVRTLSAGNHAIVLEHYEHDGVSSIHLDWEVPGNSGVSEPITGDGDAPAPLPAPITLTKNSCYASGNAVKLVWTGGEGSEVYHIKRRMPDSTIDFNSLPDIATLAVANQYQHTFFPTNAMLSYEYIVIGSNAQGLNRFSDTVYLPKPLLLQSFTLSGTMTGTTVSLSWTSAINTPVGREDWRYVRYDIKRRLKNSGTAWAQITPIQSTSDFTKSFTVDSATTSYEYVVIATNTLSGETKTPNTVLLPKPKIWDVGTPIGQYKDSAGTTIYNGRMIAPVNQTAAGFVPAVSYVVPGANVLCGIEVASDIDSWVKDVPSQGSTVTTGTEADTIQDPADYIWSFSGGVAGEGFRARGTSGPPSATFAGREAEFVVSPTSPVDTVYTLTCKIVNAHGVAISPDDEGNRTDADLVRTQQLKISASSSSLKVYRFGSAATTNTAADYNELSDTIGGEIYVALHIDLGANDRVTSTKARVRIQELADAANGVQHAANEDHVDVSILLNDKTNWQEFYDPDGTGSKQPGWWAARKSPGSSTLSAENLKFRYLIKWNTSATLSGYRYDVNQAQTGKVLGHNGDHKLAVSSVNDVIGAPIAFSTAGTAQSVANFAENVTVSNLTITDVSTNVNQDYFILDRDSTNTAYQQPQINFTIKDDADAHQYKWKICIRPTWQNYDPQTTLHDTPAAYLQGTATGAGPVSIVWSGGRKNNNTDPFDQPDPDTYTFDIYVDEVDNAASPTKTFDEAQLKAPYNMEVVSHYFQINDNIETDRKLEVGYKISDAFGVNPKSFRVDILDDLYQPKGTTNLNPTINVNFGPINVRPLSETEDGMGWRGIFVGTDNHAAKYREHKSKNSLAYNQQAVLGRVAVLIDNNTAYTAAIVRKDYLEGAFYNRVTQRNHFGIRIYVYDGTTGLRNLDASHNPNATWNAWLRAYGFSRNCVVYNLTQGINENLPGFTEMTRNGLIGSPRRSRIADSVMTGYGFVDEYNEANVRGNVVLHELAHGLGINSIASGGTGDESVQSNPKCIQYGTFNNGFVTAFGQEDNPTHFGGRPRALHTLPHVNQMRAFCGLAQW